MYIYEKCWNGTVRKMAWKLSRISNLDCHVMVLNKGKHTKAALMPCTCK